VGGGYIRGGVYTTARNDAHPSIITHLAFGKLLAPAPIASQLLGSPGTHRFMLQVSSNLQSPCSTVGTLNATQCGAPSWGWGLGERCYSEVHSGLVGVIIARVAFLFHGERGREVGTNPKSRLKVLLDNMFYDNLRWLQWHQTCSTYVPFVSLDAHCYSYIYIYIYIYLSRKVYKGKLP